MINKISVILLKLLQSTFVCVVLLKSSDWCCRGCRDGRLQERDQVLVINGSPLEPGISQQQALTLLQQSGEAVELVVARERPLSASSQPANAINTVRKVWSSSQKINCATSIQQEQLWFYLWCSEFQQTASWLFRTVCILIHPLKSLKLSNSPQNHRPGFYISVCVITKQTRDIMLIREL